MNEADFAKNVKSRLQRIVPQYEVKSGANLQHSVIFDREGELWPPGVKALYSKKLYAYQVDIVLSNGKVPLVAVELKCGPGAGYSTHDVLTYSAKATRHKELYPYLRYGMAIGGVLSIGRKFFFTNRALDFVVAVSDEAGFDHLADVVHHQAKLAEDALEILDRQKKPRVTSWENGMKWVWATQLASDDDDDKED